MPFHEFYLSIFNNFTCIFKCTVQISTHNTTQSSTILAKWLSARLRTKWLWVPIPLLPLTVQIRCLLQTRSSLAFRQTIESRFTLKLVGDMIITYSQMHRTDKYSQPKSIIWSVWLNGWVFVHEPSGCGFESRCCHYMSLFLQKRAILIKTLISSLIQITL